MTPAMRASAVAGAAITAVIVAIDIVLAADNIPDNTWSEVIRFWGFRCPLIPFAWMGLGLHFFHADTWHFQQPNGIAVLLWCAVVLELTSLVVPVHPLVSCAVGAVVFAVCWPC